MAEFPCETPVGRERRDVLRITRMGGRVCVVISGIDGSHSVHLSPEALLRFAQEALTAADEAAERGTYG